MSIKENLLKGKTDLDETFWKEKKKVLIIIKRASYVWSKIRKLTCWDRWQEEEKFLSFKFLYLFFVKKNNSQTDERNVYKEKWEIQNWGDYGR